MNTMLTKPQSIFTVSHLNQSVKALLEAHIGQIWLVGEISNFSQPASGHWYFTLKDETAQVRCAMFRGSNHSVPFRPEHGQQILVNASLTLYEARGEYQLVVHTMQPAGEGLLQQRFEQLKNKLFAEGLFDQQHKKPLPSSINSVGIITSATGAALHDILHVLKRRNPAITVIIYPTAVQGNNAVSQICKAIEIANQRNECDILIIGRGGGSLEDLWSFNEEQVARAIFVSEIPIISAVGHEVDITIADFVADLRAPTPSAAAEIVSQDQQEWLRRLIAQKDRLCWGMDYYLADKQSILNQWQSRLQQQHPQLRLMQQFNHLLLQKNRLEESIKRRLNINQHTFERQQYRLFQVSPQKRILLLQQELQQYHFQLRRMIENQFSKQQQQFELLATTLNSLSPLATLTRGYSITLNDKNQPVKHTKQLRIDEKITIHLQDGLVKANIITILPIKK